ncbi:MAG TPA: acetolactate synthase small subunit [Gammaproteobacteria bacterium]|nr:acetolactate synthase small subunit [Gammaproteobacteria bacterium]
MRHIISIVLQNEAGALTRVSNLFSSRGYNIESLNVAPTDDPEVSRLTLVTRGSEEVIDQITKQLGKLIDVVDISDMTAEDHIERELVLCKLRSDSPDVFSSLTSLGVRVLDDREGHYTVEFVGGGSDIDRLLDRLSAIGSLLSVVRSGAMAIARGTPIFERA